MVRSAPLVGGIDASGAVDLEYHATVAARMEVEVGGSSAAESAGCPFWSLLKAPQHPHEVTRALGSQEPSHPSGAASGLCF